MSNTNYEEEDLSSSTDEYTDDYEETEQFSNQNQEAGDIYDFRPTLTTDRTSGFYSLPTDDGRENPHFAIFNNKEGDDVDQSSKLELDDPRKEQEHYIERDEKKILMSEGEAVGSQGTLKPNCETHEEKAQDQDETDISSLIRRRESGLESGRALGKGYGSRRRTLKGSSPTRVEENLIPPGHELEGNREPGGYNEKETAVDYHDKEGSQLTRESVILEETKQATAGLKGTRTSKKKKTKNLSHSDSEKYDLYMSETAYQRTEALGGEGNRTRSYDEFSTWASDISKMRNEATKKGNSPNNNLTSGVKPSSASIGPKHDNYATKHTYYKDKD